MKSSYALENQIDKDNEFLCRLHNYGKNVIDNPDRYHPSRLGYDDRLELIIKKIEKHFPQPANIKIAEFGCSEGTISLLLAESGYKVLAIDLNKTALDYSRLKYEKGDIQWLNSNIDNLDWPAETLDVAIAGELIEHCAYPEDILAKILSYVRPGGLLIITTPNGSRIKYRTALPSFAQISSREQRKNFQETQFGPGGTDHLFLFRLTELASILPNEAQILERGYTGGTILINKYSSIFLKIFPLWLVKRFIRILAKIPLLNLATFNNIYAILRKVSHL